METFRLKSPNFAIGALKAQFIYNWCWMIEIIMLVLLSCNWVSSPS